MHGRGAGRAPRKKAGRLLAKRVSVADEDGFDAGEQHQSDERDERRACPERAASTLDAPGEKHKRQQRDQSRRGARAGEREDHAGQNDESRQ